MPLEFRAGAVRYGSFCVRSCASVRPRPRRDRVGELRAAHIKENLTRISRRSQFHPEANTETSVASRRPLAGSASPHRPGMRQRDSSTSFFRRLRLLQKRRPAVLFLLGFAIVAADLKAGYCGHFWIEARMAGRAIAPYSIMTSRMRRSITR